MVYLLVCYICSSLYKPFSIAFSKTFSLQIPLPSSLISMIIDPALWEMHPDVQPPSQVFHSSSFLQGVLSRDLQLQYMNRGSLISSMTLLSSSVSSPEITRSTFLPAFLPHHALHASSSECLFNGHHTY